MSNLLKVYLGKLSVVANFVESSKIPEIDRHVFHVDNIFPDKNLFFNSLELMCDMQNIPKWWRMVFNWESDIVLSLSWASGWSKFLDTKIKLFEAENQQSSFADFSKSNYFDGEAWINTKYYLDNAIVRMNSYREKIAWLLNSHSKLRFIDCANPDEKISFGKYRKAVKELPDLKLLHDVLSKFFNSKKANKIATYYRNEFVHNETPSVDWPKEAQADVLKKYDINGKLVSAEVPLYGLNPPDFQLDVLFQDVIDIWDQFVEGTNHLAKYLKENYYSKLSATNIK